VLVRSNWWSDRGLQEMDPSPCLENGRHHPPEWLTVSKMWFQIPAQGVFSACQSTEQSARAHEAIRPPHMGWFRGYQYTYMASRLIGSILRHFGSFLGGLLYCEGVGRVVVLAACKYTTEVSTRCDRSVDCL